MIILISSVGLLQPPHLLCIASLFRKWKIQKAATKIYKKPKTNLK